MLSFSKSYAAFTALHVVAFALALAVCGLYGHDLKRASDNDVDSDSKWVRFPFFLVSPPFVRACSRAIADEAARSTPLSWAPCRR